MLEGVKRFNKAVCCNARLGWRMGWRWPVGEDGAGGVIDHGAAA